MNTVPLWPGEANQTLVMFPPEGRYKTDVAADRQASRHEQRDSWDRINDTEWRLQDSVLSFAAELTPVSVSGDIPSRILNVSITAHTEASVERCAFVLEAPCREPPRYVDRCYRWRSLTGTSLLNDYGQLVVQWSPDGSTSTELRFVKGMTACELSWVNKRFRLSILLDAAALHPRWQFLPGGKASSAAPRWPKGKSLSLSLFFAQIRSDKGPGAIASRFPLGAEAGFVLTDHCDFDDIDRLRLFLYGDGRENGWLGRGLRLTKGVFTIPVSITDRRAVPTLEDATYKELIRTLHDDGSEIAPHAVTESGSLPGPVFKEAISGFATQWSSQTWIDHGNTIRYCYTMGGADDPEYDLLGTLRKNGFKLLWSYHDVPVHGSATLNLLGSSSSDTSAMIMAMLRHLAKGEFLITLHYVRSFMERHARGGWGRFIMRLLSAFRMVTGTWWEHRRLVRADLDRAIRRILGRSSQGSTPVVEIPPEPFSRKELFASSAVVYPERAVPLYCSDQSDLWLFSTLEDVHVRDILTRGALDRLISERGLHIGHSYLLNNLRYIAGLFNPGAAGLRLTDEWSDFLHYLAQMVHAGRVWNPYASRLASWMYEVQSVSLVPTGDCEVRLGNPLSWHVRGYTLLMSSATRPESVRWLGGVPTGWRKWGDWLAVWGDLPPSHEGIVQWGKEVV